MTRPKKTWNEALLMDTFWTSASALDAFINRGARYWWLSKIRKIQTPPKGATTFGDALHSVAERFLEADNLGRDKNGNPVELYPKGWETVTSRFDSSKISEISAGEATLIKQLIQIAINKGILQRSPGRKVEHQISQADLGQYEVRCFQCNGTGTLRGEDCPHCKRGIRRIQVRLNGFIDLLEPDAIIDHKTVKKKIYCKSKNKLKKDVQLNVYAFLALAFAMKGDQEIRLRHNQFLKEERDVKETTAIVTAKEVQNFWYTMIVPALQEMAKVRERARRAFDIPECKKGACQMYGGCDFLPVCSGQLTEDEIEKKFKKEIERIDRNKKETIVINSETKTETQGSNSMSLFEKMRNAQQKSTPAAAAAPKVEEPKPESAPAAESKSGGAFAALKGKATPKTQDLKKTEQKEAAPVEQVKKEITESIKTMAPWYVEGCTACSKNEIPGLNKNLNPCNICVIKSKQSEGPLPEDYEMGADEQGNIIFSKIGEETVVEEKKEEQVVEEVVQETDQQEEVQEQESVEQAPEPPAEEPVTETTTAPAENTVTKEVTVNKREDGPKTKKAAEKPPTFTLLINCAKVQGGKGIMATDVFKQVCDAMAEEAGKSYYDLDPFKRRDMIAKVAEDLVTEFCKGKTVQALGYSGSGDDYNCFVKAIMPFASAVYMAQG